MKNTTDESRMSLDDTLDAMAVFEWLQDLVNEDVWHLLQNAKSHILRVEVPKRDRTNFEEETSWYQGFETRTYLGTCHVPMLGSYASMLEAHQAIDRSIYIEVLASKGVR